MRQCSLDQGGGCLFTVSSLGLSPVGLNYYSLTLPSVLLTAMADVKIEFLTYVTDNTVKRIKGSYTGILPYNNIHDTKYPPSLSGATRHLSIIGAGPRLGAKVSERPAYLVPGTHGL
jgi:hypothetical protein